MTQAPERTRPTSATEPAVGRSIDRVDGAVKTTGASEYTADRPYPDLAHATIVHSSIARGRITAIDTAAAEDVTGVLAVITHRNAPPLKPPAARINPFDLSTMAAGTKVNYLGSDEVHWNGEPVAVVVAENLEAAVEAARLVRVSYAPEPATTDFAAAEGSAEPARGIPILPEGGRKGDAEQALAAAPVSVDMRFTTPPQNHNAIEPHATTAVWDGDRLTVHDSTQAIDFVRRHLALRFDVPLEGVRVIAPNIGGGFGGKGFIWAGTVLCAMAARMAGRPVRLALSREAVFRTVGGRAPTIQRVALGAERDGTLAAVVHTGISQVGRVGGMPETVGRQSQHLYAARTILVRHSTATLDALPNSAMRAPGEAVGTFALESGMDALAHELGMDPLELRLRNEPDRNPVDGKRFTHRNLRTAYARGAQRFGWADRPPHPRSMRDGSTLRGWGMATAFHMPIQLMADVIVRLGLDGTVVVRCGMQEIGVGAATAQAQIAADALGVPVEAVRVELGDSELPVAPMAGGSGQTAAVAASVLRACEELKRSALALARRSSASPLRGRRIDDLAARDGGLFAADGAGETYGEILARSGQLSLEGRVGARTAIGRVAGQVGFFAGMVREQRRQVRAATGAHFCEVAVDEDTGEVRVTRWVAVFDVGRVVNPKTAASQLRGGIVMGLGAALTEGTEVDPRTGRVVGAGLADYHVPVQADVPAIDVSWLDEPDPTTPLGLLGVGEVSIAGVAAAVANAVHHATGVRVTDLPLTPDRLLG